MANSLLAGMYLYRRGRSVVKAIERETSRIKTSAQGTVAADHNPCEPVITTTQAVAVDSLQAGVAFWFSQDDSDVAVTPWTGAR